MLYVQTARHQVAIAGRVTDAVTGKPITGAQVRITEAPVAFVDRMLTRARNVRFDSPALDVVRAVLDDPSATPEDVLAAAKAILSDVRARSEARVNAARAIMDNPGTKPEGRLAAAQVLLDGFQARQTATLKRPDQTLTVADGSFYFIDLPDGNYTLAVTLPNTGSRYNAWVIAFATVSRDAGTIVKGAPLEISLQPTGFEGSVRDDDDNIVSMAEIRVVGSGEVVYSSVNDKDGGGGAYRLTGLEKGNRAVRVSARGHQTKVENVTLEQGIMLPLDIMLERGPAP